MTSANKIESYISQLEFDNLQLSTALESEKARIEHLLKWIYLSGGSRVLLEMIYPETIEFCFINRYPIDKAYKVQTELIEVMTYLADYGIEHELLTKEDVIYAREQINRRISSRHNKS